MRVVHSPAPDKSPAQRLFTVLAAAEQLGTGKDYVYGRINDGELRTVELGTDKRSILRVRADDLQAFIDGRTHGTQRHLKAVHA